MTSDRLDRVKALLDEAGELPPAERSAYLDAHCDDDALRAEVESLLAYDDAEPAWPEAPLLTAPADAPTPWVEQLKPGTMVGPYRVVQPLGVGGMGAVAAAVREDDFAKTVAVKVLHEQPSRQAVRRFHDERQILAGLEHPNIARILDGGTTDEGRPYFAMELVAGEPIDVYCERNGLGIEDTVRLVLEICSALAASHQRLVVHRDIKPSNLVVTADGEPKLLDFGIAKRLGPDVTDLTRKSHRPMTLRYASPEQVAGTPVTTATDVWGVGLLLYQLLTGTHPFGSLDSGALDVAEAIRDQAPPKPSSVVTDAARARGLSGDLDAILLRALRKEPEHRYASVEALAADLRAYLEGRPVEARRGGRAYVTRRFVRRYRWPIAVTAFIVLLSITFGVVSWVLLQRAEMQRARAEKEKSISNKNHRLVQEALISARPREGQTAPEAFEATMRAVEKDVMAEETLDIRLELLAVLGVVYAGWGEIEDSCRVADRAVEDAQSHYSATHPQVVRALSNQATCRFRREDFGEASRLWDRVLSLRQRFEGTDRGELALAFANSGTGHYSLGRYEDAMRAYRRALELREVLAADFPGRGWEEKVAETWRKLSVVHLDLDEIDEAEVAARQALEWLSRGTQLKADARQRLHATFTLGLARILDEKPTRRRETEELYREALEERRQMYDGSHELVATAELDLARFLLEESDLESARALLDQALVVLDDPRDRARAQSVEALYLSQVGRLDEAEAKLEQSLATLMRGRQVPDIHARRTADWLDEVRAARQAASDHENGATAAAIAPSRPVGEEPDQGASSTETLRP